MSAPTDKANTTDKPDAEKAAATLPQLGALEEDDEFEEFPAQDWDDSETSLAHLSKAGSAATGDASKPGLGDLWEDNWDDDDIEDDFSKQLREELSKTADAGTATVDRVMS